MIEKAVFSYFNPDESFGNKCGFLRYSDFLFTTTLSILCASWHFREVQFISSSWGVDVAVSTPRIISALVEEAVSVGDVVRLFSFKKGQANLVELTLPDGSACIGKTVEEIELPEDAALAAIVRDGRVITAKAHDVFAAGDELLFVASSDAEARIKSCFISN